MSDTPRFYDETGKTLWRMEIPAWTLLRRMERYVNAAVREWNRLQEDRPDFRRISTEERFPDRKQVIWTFVDIHFFLICGDKVHALFKKLREVDPDRDTRTIWRKRRSELERFRKERDNFEHIDERIADGVRDLGNLVNDIYTFDGKEFHVGSNALETLTRTYEELVAVIAARPIREDVRAEIARRGWVQISPSIEIPAYGEGHMVLGGSFGPEETISSTWTSDPST